MKYVLVLISLTIVVMMMSCGGGGTTAMSPGDTNTITNTDTPPIAVLPADPNNLESQPTIAMRNNIGIARNTSSLAPPLYPQRKQSIAHGLDYIGATDGTFTVDGAGPYTNVWEWYRGAGVANRNIQGEVIQFTLDASRFLDDGDAYAQIAMDALNEYLVPAYSTGGPFAALRPYSFDVGALVSAYQQTGNTDYLTLATDLAQRTTTAYTGAAYADRMINIRKSLGGWDIGAYIINWHKLGGTIGGSEGNALQQWSMDCLARMWERKSEWLDIPYGGWNYSSLSVGAMLEVYGYLNDHTLVAQEDYFADQVLTRQTADGWWDINGWDDVQATCACVQGLNVAHTPKSVTAREKGELYLRSADIQLDTAPNVGCFIGYIGDTGYTGNADYIVSLSAEAASALASFYGN